MNIEEMNRIRKEYGYSYKQLAERSGVPESTIQKIFRGQTEHPRYNTLRKLEKALCTETASSIFSSKPESENCLKESSAVYDADIQKVSAPKQQGSYSIEDYYAVDDDRRVELIDGVLYDLATPTIFHQLFVLEIVFQIKTFIKENNGSCIPFIAPTAVQLDRNDKTMLEPDLGIICNRDIITEKTIYGAPDFVLEVISPSSRKKDFFIKLNKYMNAGVREYWIVDPYQRRILVYYFDGETGPFVYSITEPVPVNIYDGKLIIDLSGLEEWFPDETWEKP